MNRPFRNGDNVRFADEQSKARFEAIVDTFSEELLLRAESTAARQEARNISAEVLDHACIGLYQSHSGLVDEVATTAAGAIVGASLSLFIQWIDAPTSISHAALITSFVLLAAGATTLGIVFGRKLGSW